MFFCKGFQDSPGLSYILTSTAARDPVHYISSPQKGVSIFNSGQVSRLTSVEIVMNPALLSNLLHALLKVSLGLFFLCLLADLMMCTGQPLTLRTFPLPFPHLSLISTVLAWINRHEATLLPRIENGEKCTTGISLCEWSCRGLQCQYFQPPSVSEVHPRRKMFRRFQLCGQPDDKTQAVEMLWKSPCIHLFHHTEGIINVSFPNPGSTIHPLVVILQVTCYRSSTPPC